jgi:hypothetical protein
MSQDAEDEVSEWFVRDEAKFNLVKWLRVWPGICLFVIKLWKGHKDFSTVARILSPHCPLPLFSTNDLKYDSILWTRVWNVYEKAEKSAAILPKCFGTVWQRAPGQKGGKRYFTPHIDRELMNTWTDSDIMIWAVVVSLVKTRLYVSMLCTVVELFDKLSNRDDLSHPNPPRKQGFSQQSRHLVV